MKTIKKSLYMVCSAALVLFFITLNSCKKLPLYQDVEYTSHVLDPQQGITAWEYLNKPRLDTLFNMMLKAIQYAGMEDEYKKPERTYIILANEAITSKNETTGVESTTSYFGQHLVNGSPGKKIEDYPVEEIRDLLKYHIIEGYHTYGNLTVNPEEFNTLRTDSAVNFVTINIGNTASYILQFNNFPGSIKAQDARTSNLQVKDNCVLHVINTYMEYGRTP